MPVLVDSVWPQGLSQSGAQDATFNMDVAQVEAKVSEKTKVRGFKGLSEAAFKRGDYLRAHLSLPGGHGVGLELSSV